MSAEWIADIESTIYTIVKSETEAKLKVKYPNIQYSTTDTSNTTTNQFPSVYIHLESIQENGNTLEGTEIESVGATFGVRVTSNVAKEDCTKVMAAIVKAFKDLRFRGSSLPVLSVSSELFIANAHFRREIGAEDTI